MIEEKKVNQEVETSENEDQTTATPAKSDEIAENIISDSDSQTEIGSEDIDQKQEQNDDSGMVSVEVVEDDDDDDDDEDDNDNDDNDDNEDEESVSETEAELKESVIKEIEKPIEVKLPNYLDPALFTPKTITLDEVEQYSETEDEKIIDSEVMDLYDKSFSDIQEGQVVSGHVVNMTDNDVFVDIGFKSEGLVPRAEFLELPEMGDEVEVYITNFENRKGQFVLSKEKADFVKRWNEIRMRYENDETITGTISRRIKGGMVVSLDGVFAFLPGSQIDVRPVTDFNEHVGVEYEYKIVKFNELRKNIVLSRKVLLESDLKEKRQEIISQLEVGMILEGTVKNITDFGAFVDLGGIDGLLHMTDITWGRINHPSEVLKVEEKITIKVIDFDVDKGHVSLGMKQLEPEPWENSEDKYHVDMEISGTVVNMMKYGVFVELEKGVEGLVHVSEMSWTRHIKHPSEMFKLGDVIQAKVLSIDSKEKKISLGIKQLAPNPWDEIETKYPIDSIHKGIVRNLTQFGAFVELEEGIDGLVHVSDMSWIKNVRHPKEVVNKNQHVDVKVLDVSSDSRRLSLGIKQVETDPWPQLKSFYTAGTVVSGMVIKALDKGIIFKLEHDLEGIVPLKRVPKNDRKNIKNKFKPGTEHEVIVQEVDQEYKKVILMVELERSDQDRKNKQTERPDKPSIKNISTADKLEIPQSIIDSIAHSDKERAAEKK